MTPELRRMLQEFDAAMADPDIVAVGLSLGMVALVGTLRDTFPLPDVPGLAMVFYFAREKDDVRVLALDADAGAWLLALQASGDYAALMPWK